MTLFRGSTVEFAWTVAGMNGVFLVAAAVVVAAPGRQRPGSVRAAGEPRPGAEAEETAMPWYQQVRTDAAGSVGPGWMRTELDGDQERLSLGP